MIFLGLWLLYRNETLKESVEWKSTWKTMTEPKRGKKKQQQ